MYRRNLLCALSVSALLASVSAVPAMAQSAEAARFISQLADKAVTNLAGSGISQTERNNRFRVMFNDGFDGKAIARFALGRFVRVATEPEQAEYFKLFEELIVQTYSNRFAEYAGESLRVTGTRPGPDNDVIVASDLVRPNGPPIQVQWRVHRDEYGQKVNDIMVEGVSMIQIHRDDFAAVIQRGGGKVDALLVMLRSKTAQNAAAAAAPAASANPRATNTPPRSNTR